MHCQSRLSQRRSTGAFRRRRATRVGTMLAIALGAGTLAACGGGGEIRAESGEVIAPGPWSVFDLRVGDCIDDAGAEGDISEVQLVPCVDPHTQEVFATVEHPDDAYPGASEVALWADAQCLGELQSSLGLTLADGLFVSYLLPSFDGWNKNSDRTVVCVLVFPTRGSVSGSYVSGDAVDVVVTTTEAAA